VSLVGIVLADVGLHLPDFRAHEKLFQLLIQVSGRSGRGAQGGEVVLQTYQPDHPAILKAAAYDYEGFMKEELQERQALFYPPFSRMALFQSAGDPAGLLETLKMLFKERGVQAQFSMAPNYDLYLRTADFKPLSGWKAPKGVKVEVDPLSLI
jgi:primosomal protein N'